MYLNYSDGRRQIVLYQSGVGSEADFAGNPETGTTKLRESSSHQSHKSYVFTWSNFIPCVSTEIFGTAVGQYSLNGCSKSSNEILTNLHCKYNFIASKIRDAYAFIAQNFADGDEICIFGFV